MASIWFGDLNDCFINISSDTNKNIKDILDELYSEWSTKHPEIFNEFKPVLINNSGELYCDEDLLTGFDDNEYSLSFISQGTSNHHISWGSSKYQMGNNQIIREFTNDMLKRLGEGSQLSFSFQVIADDGYENCEIEVSPNFDDKYPKVDESSEFYSEDNGDDEDY
jgi:hypothetical protein